VSTRNHLNDAQLNYTVTEKEFLAVIFALEKFRAYLIGPDVILYTDHSALKHHLSKKDVKPRLMRWILLMQEFNCEFRDKKGSVNLVADHLSRIIYRQESESQISECFSNEQLFIVHSDPWFVILLITFFLVFLRNGLRMISGQIFSPCEILCLGLSILV